QLFRSCQFKAGDNWVQFTGRGARVDRGWKAGTARGARCSQEQANSDTQCYRCGMDTHTADECGAKTATCLFCQKMGHYARMCFRKKKKAQADKNSDKSKDRNKEKEKTKSGKPVRAVVQDTSDSNSDECTNNNPIRWTEQAGSLCKPFIDPNRTSLLSDRTGSFRMCMGCGTF
uniref:CCHC-type domain-containing protein n=1 Tax=Paramormyrops kingsleyae TaxID=1676925 RepID=A0A3B3RVT1_9TELE